MMTLVTVSVRELPDGAPRLLTLGEFHTVWRRGITIGTDPSCTVRLISPAVAPVAARASAGGHHLLLTRFGEDGRADRARVDRSEFVIGDHALRFGEIDGDEALDDLKRAPQQDDPSDVLRRVHHMDVLAWFGDAAREAIPALVLQGAHPDARVRDGAARALARLGVDPGGALTPELLERWLDDDDPPVRSEALACLTLVRSERRPDLTRIRRALADPAPNVRLAAAVALWRIARDAEGLPAIHEVLADHLRDDLAEQEREKAELRARYPHSGGGRVVTSEHFLRARIADPALACVGEMGPRAAALAPLLVEGLAAETWHGSEVEDALAGLGAAVVPLLLPLLAVKNPALRSAVRVLGRIGPAADAALPALLGVRREAEWAWLGREIADAVRAIQGPGPSGR